MPLKISIVNQKLAIALLLSVGVACLYATYKSIDNIVTEQSRLQQQAVSPVYKLVRDELLRPFYIAETFASSVDFTAPMESDSFDEDALLARLKAMEEDLGLIFFVASEQTRKQYFSSGATMDLVEGQVAWYFEAKAADKDFMADLGQVGDVHLFFDVKMYGPDREFLGYVGVGKSVQRFLDTFERFKSRYDYDFLFVNDRNEIMLSSLPDLVVTDAYIPTLESTEWFPAGNGRQAGNDSDIIRVESEDFLISEFGIEELGWRLLLLVPLEARQAQITSAFVTNALSAGVVVMLLAGALLVVMLIYKRNIEKKVEVDLLTGLPNRSYVQRHFGQMQRSGESLSVVLIDLDRFKHVNDTYGHDAGDRVLIASAAAFKDELREEDVVGRWGGEEFVMLIPSPSIELGHAIAERARRSLERLTIETADAELNVTASFGVAHGSAVDESLDDLLKRADAMLYQAKERGRNQVQLYEAA